MNPNPQTAIPLRRPHAAVVPLQSAATQAPLTSEDLLSRSLPRIWETQAWAATATPRDCAVAVAAIVTATELGMAPDRRMTDGELAVFTRLVTAYQYTRAELVYAAREVPRDPESAHCFNRPVGPADVERVVRRVRELRARLSGELMPGQVARLIGEVAAAGLGELHREEHFRCCGYASDGETKLYRFVGAAERAAEVGS